MTRLIALAVPFLVAMTIVVAPAGAQTVNSGYPNPGGAEQTAVSQQTGVSQQRSSGGQLPFTGLDVAFVFGGGVGLVLLGFGLARLTRPSAERQ